MNCVHVRRVGSETRRTAVVARSVVGFIAFRYPVSHMSVCNGVVRPLSVSVKLCLFETNRQNLVGIIFRQPLSDRPLAI